MSKSIPTIVAVRAQIYKLFLETNFVDWKVFKNKTTPVIDYDEVILQGIFDEAMAGFLKAEIVSKVAGGYVLNKDLSKQPQEIKLDPTTCVAVAEEYNRLLDMLKLDPTGKRKIDPFNFTENDIFNIYDLLSFFSLETAQRLKEANIEDN